MTAMPGDHLHSSESVLFEAAIMPHRSLSRRGRQILVGIFCAVSMLTGLRFWMIGAWPVAGFIAIELGLAAFLLWRHQRSARETEWLRLSPDEIRIARIDPNGRKSETRLATGWLRVRLEERPGRVPGLLLYAPGRQVEVAKVLGEVAKRDLAQALKNAVHEIHNPRFDNPQLRE